MATDTHKTQTPEALKWGAGAASRCRTIGFLRDRLGWGSGWWLHGSFEEVDLVGASGGTYQTFEERKARLSNIFRQRTWSQDYPDQQQVQSTTIHEEVAEHIMLGHAPSQS